jgi:hypothetical protein
VSAAIQLTLISLASRFYSYSHSPRRDFRHLPSHASMVSSDLERALRQFVQNCNISVQIGSPPLHEVSPIREVAEFNQAVQIYVMFITLRNYPLTIFHIVDSATAHPIAHTASSRDL